MHSISMNLFQTEKVTVEEQLWEMWQRMLLVCKYRPVHMNLWLLFSVTLIFCLMDGGALRQPSHCLSASSLFFLQICNNWDFDPWATVCACILVFPWSQLLSWLQNWGILLFHIFQPKQMSQILELQTSNAKTFTELSSSAFLRYWFKYVPPSVFPFLFKDFTIFTYLRISNTSYVFELSSQESSISLSFHIAKTFPT